MADIDDIYGSGEWLKAPSLQREGHDSLDLTIKGCRTTTMDDGKKQIVLSFEERDEELGLNVTNSRAIAQFLGARDYTQWVGRKICVYVSQLDRPFKGSTHCLRVRAVSQQPTAPVQHGDTLGMPAQDKLGLRLTEIGKTLDELIFALHDRGVTVSGPPSTWPKSSGLHIAPAIEALQNPAKDEIPF